MRFICLLVIFGTTWCSAEIRYQEPDFQAKLFDQSKLTLAQDQRIELAWALTSLARNFPEDSTVGPRAKAMALLLSHQFLPFDRDTVIANFHLRHGLETLSTGHFETKEAAIAKMETIENQEAPNGPDTVLKLLIQDVLNELLGRERVEESRWQGLVTPAPRQLARSEASLRYITSKGEVASCTALASPLNGEGQFRVRHGEAELSLSPDLLQRLAERFPYISQRLEISLVMPSDHSFFAGRRDLFVEILIDQLVEEWDWPANMALCGVAESLPDTEVLSRLNAFHKRADAAELTVLVVPPLPAVVFRDWMAFGQLHQLARVALVSANSFSDVMNHQQADHEHEAVRDLFKQCQLILRKGVASPDKLRKNTRLMGLLSEIAKASPSHLSTEILRTYASFERAPRGTLPASLDWLETLSSKGMPRSSRDHDRQFRETTCRQILAALRQGHRRVASKAQPLIGALERYVEHHAIPYSRVTAKQTKTAQRQFDKLIRARNDYQAAVRRVKRDS